MISTPTRRFDAPSARATFPAERESVRRARSFVAEYLLDWLGAERFGDGHDDDGQRAMLLVSELVSNAVLHAETAAVVEIGCSGPSSAPATLHLSVSDGVTSGIEPALAGDPTPIGAASGRGLRIVDAFADRWGVSIDVAGKTVWCEMAVQGA